MWDDFPGCKCLKFILCQTGYDNVPSLKCLTEINLIALEQYIEEKREIIGGMTLKCSHIQNYKMQSPFIFLPGHKQLLLNWCQNLILEENKFSTNHPAFQPILREIITASLSYHNKSSNIEDFRVFS